MSVIDFVAIMPYYIGLTMSDDNTVSPSSPVTLTFPPILRHFRLDSSIENWNEIYSITDSKALGVNLPDWRTWISLKFDHSICAMLHWFRKIQKRVEHKTYLLSHLPILIFFLAGVWSICHSPGLQGLSHFQILPTLTGTQDSWVYPAGQRLSTKCIRSLGNKVSTFMICWERRR